MDNLKRIKYWTSSNQEQCYKITSTCSSKVPRLRKKIERLSTLPD